jgi:hypothetical protein
MEATRSFGYLLMEAVRELFRNSVHLLPHPIQRISNRSIPFRFTERKPICLVCASVYILLAVVSLLNLVIFDSGPGDFDLSCALYLLTFLLYPAGCILLACSFIRREKFRTVAYSSLTFYVAYAAYLTLGAITGI